MSEPVRCASCGLPLDPPGPGGLCPICLLKMGMQAAEEPYTAGAPASGAPAAGGARRHRPVSPAPGARRGRHGPGLPGRAARAARPARRPQAHQARDGHPRGAGALRGRAPGPRADGPPEHRPRPGCGPRAGRPAVLRHGVRRRRAHHRLLRPPSPAERRAPADLPAGVRRAAARAPEGHHPSGPEALEHPGHGAGRQAGPQGDRLRDCEGHAPGRASSARRSRSSGCSSARRSTSARSRPRRAASRWTRRPTSTRWASCSTSC